MSRERALVEQVAGKGLLGSYVQYARTLTAAPLQYHLATGLCVISGAAGAGATFYGGGNTEHWPNLYVCVLGPTGFHKTTAIRIGCRMLERAAPGTIAPNEFSREQFLANLQRNPNALMEVDEFSVLLSQMERTYMAGLKETLTDLYDPHPTYTRTLRGQHGQGETIRINRPALTILAASNIDWLVEHLTEVDFRSGFMPRFLLWPSDLREPEPPDGMLARGDAVIETSLLKQLHALSTVHQAPVEWSAGARRRVSAFSRERMAVAETESVPGELLGLVSRSGLHSAKLAVLLCLSDQGHQERYEISSEQAERACLLMAWLIDQAENLFEAHIVFEKFERKAQKLLGTISDSGVEWSVALKRSKVSADDFRKMVSTLQERGQVDLYSEARDGRGRSASARMLRRAYPRKTGNSANSGELHRELHGEPGINGVVDFPLKRVVGAAEEDV